MVRGFRARVLPCPTTDDHINGGNESTDGITTRMHLEAECSITFNELSGGIELPVLRDRDVAIHDVTRRVIALDVAEYPIVRANQGKLLIRLSQVVRYGSLRLSREKARIFAKSQSLNSL